MFDTSRYLTVCGKNYRLDREMVLKAAGELKSEGDTGRISKYYLLVDGVRFSPAKVVARAVECMPIEVGGQVAFRSLTTLGFKVLMREKVVVPEEPGS